MIKFGQKVENLENSYTIEGGRIYEKKKRDGCYAVNSHYSG